MNFKIDPKILEEAEKDLLNDFSNFVEEKRNPNIFVNKNVKRMFSLNIFIPIYFYPNRVNKIEAFWEKKMFNFLLTFFKDNFDRKEKLEILDVHLSPGTWDTKDEMIPYNFKYRILLTFKILRIQ